jgi:hypothetical protein
MPADLMGALKALFAGSPALAAAIPGGWHANEGAALGTLPYVTARQFAGPIGLRTSTSNVDDVRVRVRVWGNRLDAARAAADALEAAFLGAGGLTWDGGWSTKLERVDRAENKEAGRAPGDAGVLRMVDLVFLARCRRPA